MFQAGGSQIAGSIAPKMQWKTRKSDKKIAQFDGATAAPIDLVVQQRWIPKIQLGACRVRSTYSSSLSSLGSLSSPFRCLCCAIMAIRTLSWLRPKFGWWRRVWWIHNYEDWRLCQSVCLFCSLGHFICLFLNELVLLHLRHRKQRLYFCLLLCCCRKSIPVHTCRHKKYSERVHNRPDISGKYLWRM